MDDRFYVKVLPEKGRAVFTRKQFESGEFLLQYHGPLIDKAEGDRRDDIKETGFRYFFNYKNKELCIDASEEDPSNLARLVNHCRNKRELNSKMRVVANADDNPELHLFALCQIPPDTEVLYNYGLPYSYRFPPPACFLDGGKEQMDREGDTCRLEWTPVIADDSPGNERDAGKMVKEMTEEGSREAQQGREVCLEQNAETVSLFQGESVGSEPVQGITHNTEQMLSQNSDEGEVEQDKTTKENTPGSPTQEERKNTDEEVSGDGNNVATMQNGDTTDSTSHDKAGCIGEIPFQDDTEKGKKFTTKVAKGKDDKTCTAGTIQQGKPSELDLLSASSNSEDGRSSRTTLPLHSLPGSSGLQSQTFSKRLQNMDKSPILGEEFPHEVQKNIFQLSGNIPESDYSDSNFSDVIPLPRRAPPRYSDSDPSSDLQDDQQYLPSDTHYSDSDPSSDSQDDQQHSPCAQEKLVGKKKTGSAQRGRKGKQKLKGTSKAGRKVKAAFKRKQLDSDSSDDEEGHVVRKKSCKEHSAPQECTIPSSSDEDNESEVQLSSKGKGGQRRWDSKDHCLYCDEAVAKIFRHCCTQHSKEKLVLEISALPLHNKERKAKISLLRNRGNLKHNRTVWDTGEGQIKPRKRPTEADKASASDYLPCEFCEGSFKRESLWMHQKLCSIRNGKGRVHGRVQGVAKMLATSGTPGASIQLTEKVLSRMQVDEVTAEVRKDQDILAFGTKLLSSHPEDHHALPISQRMRDVAKALIESRKIDRSITHMRDCIDPAKFDTVIKAVKAVAGYDSSSNSYKTPSYARNIGFDIDKVVAVVQSDAIKANDGEGDDALKLKVEGFRVLKKNEWSSAVSSAARCTLDKRSVNKAKLQPMASDVQKLTQYLKHNTEQYKRLLKDDGTSTHNWNELSRMTLAHINLFNRRRSGEVQRLRLDQYAKMTNDMASIPQEVHQTLSEVEKALVKKLHRVEIPGKRRRTVPVLMTGSMVENVDLLISTRSTAGVASDNPYVFARPYFGSLHPVPANDCLRKYSIECGALFPELLRSTKLRKHVATMSQILSLKDNELDC